MWVTRSNVRVSPRGRCGPRLATASSVRIVSADDLSDGVAVARELFREYADELGIDLGFQGFASELATLPGPYGSPRGALLLACDGAAPVGCVALRELDADTAELKRLFVRAGARGRGVGRLLAVAAAGAARARSYRSLVLDTLSSMVAARRLYAELGFVDCAPYTYNPLPGARFMRLDLAGD